MGRTSCHSESARLARVFATASDQGHSIDFERANCILDQRCAIEYLLTENRVLQERIGKKRILLNDGQRRRLAVKGRIIGRKILEQLTGILTPETILRGHRGLRPRHWDYSDRQKATGRPLLAPWIVELGLRLAKESPTWGYDRIQGALTNLGHRMSDTTVADVIRAHGIEAAPARRRQLTWKIVLEAHWEVPAPPDLTTIEIWTRNGLVIYSLLLFINLAACRAHVAGPAANPDEGWILQVARNVTDAEEGFLRGEKYLLMDRDAKFPEAFGVILEQAGVYAVRLSARSPDLNSNLECILRSVNEEGRRRAGGMLRYYYREAA